MDSRLVGVWEWLYQDYGYNYTLTVKADHTGSLVVTSQNVGGTHRLLSPGKVFRRIWFVW